jgi:hypothetical protein
MSHVLKLDRAMAVDFLSSIAGVLAQHQCITQKDTDSLRLVLSSLQSATNHSESLMIDLIGQDAEFIRILENRYSVVGIHQNLLRYTLKPMLNDLIVSLSEFGEALVQKSQAFLNRQAVVYIGSHPQSRVLFSSLLVELSQEIAKTCEALQEAVSSCHRMSGNAFSISSTEDDAIDQAVAKSLGFHHVNHAGLPFLLDTKTLQTIGAALLSISSTVEQFMETIQRNFKGNLSARIKLLNEHIKLHAGFVAGFNLFGELTFEGCEIRRIRLLSAISDCGEKLITIKENTSEMLNSLSSITPQEQYTDDVRRQIASDLIKKSISVKQAEEAAKNLIEYCSTNQIAPAQMLSGEIHKADKNLSESSLEILKRYHDERSISKSSAQKKNVITESSRKLLTTFRQNIKSLSTTILALFVLGTLSCGLKTQPRSDILDPKPGLPLRPYKPVKEIDLDKSSPEKPAPNKSKPSR